MWASSFPRPGCLSNHGVGILDGPEHLRASKNLRIIIPFELMIHKHMKAKFSPVNPTLLIELSVWESHLEGSRILKGELHGGAVIFGFFFPPACFTKASAKRCLSPADKTAPIMPHSQARSVGRVLLAATRDLRLLHLLNFNPI